MPIAAAIFRGDRSAGPESSDGACGDGDLDRLRDRLGRRLDFGRRGGFGGRQPPQLGAAVSETTSAAAASAAGASAGFGLRSMR